MKTVVLIFFFSLPFIPSFTQIINFDWAKVLDRRYASAGEETYLIGVDSAKNVYLAGNFSGTVDFDPGPGVFNLSTPSANIFICKLDSAGKFIWAKLLGNEGHAEVRSLFIDPAGNVYTTGRFSYTADFDPGPGVFYLKARNGCFPSCVGVFISKLDRDGNFKWAKQVGGDPGISTGNSITVDAAGNVYTTGYLDSINDMDPGSGVDSQGSQGIGAPFILKLDSAGNYKYARVFNANYDATGNVINVDRAGNVYTCGTFGGTVDFDPGPGTASLTANFYSQTLFLVKLDAAGNFVWVKQDVGGNSFAIDAMDNIVTCFRGTISKYNSNGDLLWTKYGGGTPSQALATSPLALDAAGNIYITGFFRYTQDFDPGPGTYNMTTAGSGYNSDVFISRLDANGNFVWAKSFGSSGEDFALSIALDGAGNVYTAGVFVWAVDFDPGPGVYSVDPPLGSGIFVHKMKRCADSTGSILNISACNSYTLNGVTYSRSGTYRQSMVNATGCDSTITLSLTLGGGGSLTAVTACNSYTWHGRNFTATGLYTDTIKTAAGCDNIDSLRLLVKPRSVTAVNMLICEGSSYAGHATPGQYIDTFAAANGCDSIRTLNLTVLARKYVTISHTICGGETYLGYNKSGRYTDTLRAASGCDSIRMLLLTVNPVYAGTVNKTICEGEVYSGHSSPGTYKDTLSTITGCDSVLTIHLAVTKKPVPQIGRDTSICGGQTLTLSPGGFPSYVWQDGSVGSRFTVKSPGVYSVTVTNSCGSGTATIKVEERSCTIYFPTAFTPNHDGINDNFKILNATNITNFQLAVYNRYGQKIFETEDYTKGWNGTYKNNLVDNGSYVWISTFKEAGTQRAMKGTVVLIR